MKKRPTLRLFDELDKSNCCDFDKELLHEDRWVPDETSGRTNRVVEAILDNELPLSTSFGCTQLQFLIKWVGHDEPKLRTAVEFLREGCFSIIFNSRDAHIISKRCR